MNVDARLALQRVRPTERQIAQPGGLAVHANRLVKGERFGDRRVRRRRRRADLLEFPDVVRLSRRGGLERPRLRDVFLSHVQKTVADRAAQPLVQARAVEINVQIAKLEREVRRRVRAVDDRRDAALPGEAAQLLNREQLAGEVRDMAEMQDFRARRDRFFEPFV